MVSKPLVVVDKMRCTSEGYKSGEPLLFSLPLIRSRGMENGFFPSLANASCSNEYSTILAGKKKEGTLFPFSHVLHLGFSPEISSSDTLLKYSFELDVLYGKAYKIYYCTALCQRPFTALNNPGEWSYFASQMYGPCHMLVPILLARKESRDRFSLYFVARTGQYTSSEKRSNIDYLAELCMHFCICYLEHPQS